MKSGTETTRLRDIEKENFRHYTYTSVTLLSPNVHCFTIGSTRRATRKINHFIFAVTNMINILLFKLIIVI